MEVDRIEVIELELKYCERCGGLWLRPRGAEQVYCLPCVPKMVRWSTPGKRKGKQRLPVNDLEIQGRCVDTVALCGEGGQA